MNTPFTFKQAQKICNTYQFLIGMSYDKEFKNTTPILDIVIAPFEEHAQQEFMDDFDLLGYTDLKSFDSKNGYEVIVIARYRPDEEICLWMDIRNFVKKNMMQVAQCHKKHILSRNESDGIAA